MIVNIDIEVNVKEENDIFSCYVPEYDIIFSTKNKNDIEKKTKSLVKSYFSALHNDNMNCSLI